MNREFIGPRGELFTIILLSRCALLYTYIHMHTYVCVCVLVQQILVLIREAFLCIEQWLIQRPITDGSADNK